jgi:small ligand-binding sensory domain FIST
MRFHDAVSTSLDRGEALDQLCAGAESALGGPPADLALLFLTPHHLPEAPEIAAEVRKRTGARHLIGCTGEALIGAGREIEGQPALSLWAASLPGVGIRTFSLAAKSTAEGFALTGMPHPLADESGPARAMLLVADPFSMPADVLLRNLDEDHPGLPVVGGMASGGQGPGQNLLLRDEEALRQGGVGAVLTGPIEVRTVVSQGCRPIGKPWVVTRCEQNVIHELGGRPAMAALKETFEGLDTRDRDLFQNAPHVGCVIDEQRESFGRGDFLVRNLIWADPQRGSLAVGELLRRGQTVQFHVRDAETADEDLAALLAPEEERGAGGGILFSCNGRGRRLFSDPDHDVSSIRSALGTIPVAGFFAAGEIGPVGGRNFLHGYTASLALLRPAAS